MSKKRVPLQVDPKFRDVLRKVQGEMMMEGQNKSLRDLTEDIAKSGIINIDDLKMEITIKMDKRRKYV